MLFFTKIHATRHQGVSDLADDPFCSTTQLLDACWVVPAFRRPRRAWTKKSCKALLRSFGVCRPKKKRSYTIRFKVSQSVYSRKLGCRKRKKNGSKATYLWIGWHWSLQPTGGKGNNEYYPILDKQMDVQPLIRLSRLEPLSWRGRCVCVECRLPRRRL